MTNRHLIMVIDDESSIRRVLSLALNQEGFDVCVADSGQYALSTLASMHTKPDLIVLDYMMPEMDGIEFLEKLRKNFSIPVIFLSARGELSSKTRAFEVGADDYLTKPFALEELFARIRAVLKRSYKTTMENSKTLHEFTNGPFKVFPLQKRCTYEGKEIRLTDTEIRLFSIMVSNPGKFLSHEELLAKVWGSEYIGETNYLRVTFTRIRQKLSKVGADGSVISSYSGVGYIMTDLRR